MRKAIILAVLLLAGCGTANEMKVAAGLYNDWNGRVFKTIHVSGIPWEDRNAQETLTARLSDYLEQQNPKKAQAELLKRFKISTDMPTDAVLAAWGEPREVRLTKKGNELWGYGKDYPDYGYLIEIQNDRVVDIGYAVERRFD